MKTSHPEAVAVPRVNPGETLRKVRESRGLALSDVAVQLNLTAQSLRCLEEGAFEQLPGHTFARGYVRTYAKLMELDPDQLVRDFDHYTGTDASGSSVASLARIEEPARVSQGLVKFFSVVVLLAIGGAGFLWWQGEAERMGSESTKSTIEHVEVEAADGTTELHPLGEPEDDAVIEAQGEGAVEQPPEVASGDELGAPEVADVDPAAPATPTQPAPAIPPVSAQIPNVSDAVAPPAETQNAVPPAGAAAQAPAAPTAAVPAVPAAGEALINLQFTADCWTQLTDANGKVLLSALKRRGDSVELTGKAPLELRLGYARGAVVLVNGQPVDVASSTHGETARLKLGQ